MAGVMWTWVDESEKPGVTVNDRTFVYGQFTLKELKDWISCVQNSQAVFEVLLKARRAWEKGQMPSYRGAREKILELLEEFRAASEELGRVLRGVNTFFDPPSIFDSFQFNVEAFKEFCNELESKLLLRATK